MEDQRTKDRQTAGNGLLGFPQEVGNERVAQLQPFPHQPATAGYSHGSRAEDPWKRRWDVNTPTWVQRTNSSSEGRSFMKLGREWNPGTSWLQNAKPGQPDLKPAADGGGQPVPRACRVPAPGDRVALASRPSRPGPDDAVRVDLPRHLERGPVIEQAVDVAKPRGAHAVVRSLHVDVLSEVRLDCRGPHAQEPPQQALVPLHCLAGW